MAVTAEVLTDAQRATLAAICDTYVPAVDADTHDPVERDFMARAASDMGIPTRIEATMAQTMGPEEIEAFAGLLDALAERGMAELPLEGRTQLLHGTADADPEAKAGLHGLKQLVTLLFYALPDEQGRNPNWEATATRAPTRRRRPRRRRRRRSRSPRSRTTRRSRPTSAWSAPAPEAP